MHYTGMAAADFPVGAFCGSAGALGGTGLTTLVALGSVALLAMTLTTSLQDARMQGKTHRLSGSLHDANTRLRRANGELRRRALLDPLTDLPNRKLFEQRLAQAVARINAPGGRPLAVLFIDLDGFKPVNDSFGHATGDLVLKEVAQRIGAQLRRADTVARVGGDEFLLLMEDVEGPAECLALAERLIAALGQPFDLAGRDIQISASVGVAIHPDDGAADQLMSHADAAMYAAKRAGGGVAMRFESHMDARPLEQMGLLHDLRLAIERDELQLHYQPKVDATGAGPGGGTSGVEALLRWRHPQRGMVPPAVFIPVAERFGLIHALGAWVIDAACRQQHAWAAQGLHLRVAVNLSVHQLRRGDVVECIRAALLRWGVAPAQLLCEITESVAMEDLRATQRTLDGLGQLGVRLSIDDFGTGYSSLSTLRQLQAQELKIDRSFVNDLVASADARAIVDAVVRLAHALGLRVVAEGVETAAQRDLLLALGCDELQGYFFARPMPGEQVPAWVQARQAAGRAPPLPAARAEEATV
jgi:diguanylate cyclase (GGDEF)-like protein